MRTGASDEKSIVSNNDVSQQQVWNVSHAQDACDILTYDILHTSLAMTASVAPC